MSKTTTQAPEPTTQDEESKVERVTVSAPTLFDLTTRIIGEAGPEGITLKDLTAKVEAEAGDLIPEGKNTYRVLHNVTWRLEGSPEVRPNNKAGRKLGEPAKPDEVKVQRVGGGRTVKYATI